MKCLKCGKRLPKNKTTCPKCGYEHTLEQRLTDQDIPKELSHLSRHKISRQIVRMRQLHHKKYHLLIGCVLFILLAWGLFLWFQHRDEIGDVHNFHDDLVEMSSSNAAGNTIYNWANGASAVTYGNHIYVAGKDSLYQIPLTLEKRTDVFQADVSGLNLVSDKLYYINHDEENQIQILDILKNEMTSTDYQAKDLAVIGSYIYYMDQNSQAIYQAKTDFSENRVLTQSGVLAFSIVGDWLYYSTQEGIYRIPLLGGEVMKLVSGEYRNFQMDDRLIYYLDRSGYINQMKMDGTETKRVVADRMTSFIIHEHYLFYAKKTGGIFKMDLDNGTITQLSVDRAFGLQLAGSWIYYQMDEEEGSFVSIDEKSHQAIPLYSIPE